MAAVAGAGLTTPKRAERSGGSTSAHGPRTSAGGSVTDQPSVSNAFRYLQRLAPQPLPRASFFERSVVHRAFEPGEVIFDVGDSTPHLYVVIKGGAKIGIDWHGTERLTGIARPGEFLGSLPAILPNGFGDLLRTNVGASSWEAPAESGVTDLASQFVTTRGASSN